MDADSDDATATLPGPTRTMPRGISGIPFTAEQEQFIINLRENQPEPLQWQEMSEKFNDRYPSSPRSKGALQVHYCRSLQPSKRRLSRRSRRPDHLNSDSVQSDDHDEHHHVSNHAVDSQQGTDSHQPRWPRVKTEEACPDGRRSPTRQNIKSEADDQEGIGRDDPAAEGVWTFDKETEDILKSGRKRARPVRSYYMDTVLASDDGYSADSMEDIMTSDSLDVARSISKGIHPSPKPTSQIASVPEKRQPSGRLKLVPSRFRQAKDQPSVSHSISDRRAASQRRKTRASNRAEVRKRMSDPDGNLDSAVELDTSSSNEGSGPEDVVHLLDSDVDGGKSKTNGNKLKLSLNVFDSTTKRKKSDLSLSAVDPLSVKPASAAQQQQQTTPNKPQPKRPRLDNGSIEHLQSLPTKPPKVTSSPIASTSGWQIIDPVTLLNELSIPAVFRQPPAGRVIEKLCKEGMQTYRTRWLRAGEEPPNFSGNKVTKRPAVPVKLIRNSSDDAQSFHEDHGGRDSIRGTSLAGSNLEGNVVSACEDTPSNQGGQI